MGKKKKDETVTFKIVDPKTLELCEVCGNIIKTQIFKGTKWCSDNCRKILSGELTGDAMAAHLVSRKPNGLTPWEDAALTRIVTRGLVERAARMRAEAKQDGK